MEMQAENFPNLVRDINLQIWEVAWILNMRDPKKSRPRWMTIKLLETKDKEKICKVAKEKRHFTYMGKLSWMTMDFSSKTTEARSHIVFFECWKKRTVKSVKNIFQDWRRDHDILKWKEN